jgi:hypothetical protein
VADALPLFVVSLVNLSPLSGRLMAAVVGLACGLPARFFSMLCALRATSAPRVLFGGLLLASEGERFPLLSALLRCRFTALRALLCRLCVLCGFGLPFRFLLQCTLACSFAGGGCGAGVMAWRFWPRSICLRVVLAHSSAADWERWSWWQRKSTSRPSGVVACPVACQVGWLDRDLLRLLRVDVESHTGPSRTPIRMAPPWCHLSIETRFAALLDARLVTCLVHRVL